MFSDFMLFPNYSSVNNMYLYAEELEYFTKGEDKKEQNNSQIYKTVTHNQKQQVKLSLFT